MNELINFVLEVYKMINFGQHSKKIGDHCCDPDATTQKLDGSPKDFRAKPLCELTPNKQCSFHKPNQV
jgi:hypothetical protein